jgi:hypothetical protein
MKQQPSKQVVHVKTKSKVEGYESVLITIPVREELNQVARDKMPHEFMRLQRIVATACIMYCLESIKDSKEALAELVKLAGKVVDQERLGIKDEQLAI